MTADTFEVAHPMHGILQCSTYLCEGRRSSLGGIPLLGIAGKGYSAAHIRVWIVAHTLPRWLQELEAKPAPITLARVSKAEPFICLVSMIGDKAPEFVTCYASHEAATYSVQGA